LAALQAGVEVEVEGTPLKLGANINIKSVKVLGGSVTQTGTDTGPITTTGNTAFDGESTISSGISFSTPLASANYEVSSSFRDEYTFNDTASSGGSIGIPYTPLSYSFDNTTSVNANGYGNQQIYTQTSFAGLGLSFRAAVIVGVEAEVKTGVQTTTTTTVTTTPAKL